MSKIAKKRKRLNIISNVYAFLVYALLYIPVAVMMVFSFNDQKYNYYWNGFTTQWYAKLFTNSTLVDSLIYSLIIAVLSTLISVFNGTIGALGLKRYEFIVPEIVLAVALLIIFLKVGVSMGMGTILIGHCTFCIPYAIVTIKGRISGDNETLEEASMDLGANRVQTLLRVTLPNIFPGVMSAAFLSFTMSFDDVVMSNMLAGAKQSTLPVLILSMNKTGVTPDVNALATIMVLIIVAAMILNNIIQGALHKRVK